MFDALRNLLAKRRTAKLAALKRARQECISKLSTGRLPLVSAHELRALTHAQLRLEVGK